MPAQFPKLLFDNRFSDAVPTADTVAAGYSPANVRDWRAYTWYKATAMPTNLYVDSGSAKSASAWAIVGHDLFSRGVTSVNLYGSASPAYSPQTLVDSFTPASDAPVFRQFSSTSWRYWRVTINGPSIPSLAIVAVGAPLAMPRPLARGFDPVGRALQGVVNRSEKGHPLGRAVEFEEWSAQLDFSLLTPAWVRATWLPAWRNHLRGRPFLFAWDPGDYADEVRLVTAGDSFRSATQGAYCSLSFSVSGLA